MIVHLTHTWGVGYGVACSSCGSDWEQTQDRRKVTCERCQGTVQFCSPQKAYPYSIGNDSAVPMSDQRLTQQGGPRHE